MELILGGRTIREAERKLREFRTNDLGRCYYDYAPVTSPDLLTVEDIAITLAFSSRATARAVRSMIQRGPTLRLCEFPDRPLEDTSHSERQAVAELIANVATWPGFAASLATKVLHKKRPKLIPVLDNQAIFGAYMNADWPNTRASAPSEKRYDRILGAVEQIATDLNRPENQLTWTELRQLEQRASLIEIFDMVWWIYQKEERKGA